MAVSFSRAAISSALAVSRARRLGSTLQNTYQERINGYDEDSDEQSRKWAKEPLNSSHKFQVYLEETHDIDDPRAQTGSRCRLGSHLLRIEFRVVHVRLNGFDYVWVDVLF